MGFLFLTYPVYIENILFFLAYFVSIEYVLHQKYGPLSSQSPLQYTSFPKCVVPLLFGGGD